MNTPSANTPSPPLTVIGEALIDFVPKDGTRDYRAIPGGSPFNVAIGLARLGHPTQLLVRLADTPLGNLLRAQAEAEGVDLHLAPHATEPASLAFVALDAHGVAQYDFYMQGTADWQWTDAELGQLGPETTMLHFGSLASWTPPGSQRILALAQARHAQKDTLISYDPNVRPLLLGDPAHARPLIEACVRVAHLVKASRDDLAWLYPAAATHDVMQHWHTLGPSLVVVTDGAAGADATFAPNYQPVHRPARQVTVADTVGAGDAFMAGMLSTLANHGVTTPDALRTLLPQQLVATLDRAMLVAALTCQRVGADPPRLGELADAEAS